MFWPHAASWRLRAGAGGLRGECACGWDVAGAFSGVVAPSQHPAYSAGAFRHSFLYLCSRANSAAPFLKPMLKLRIRAARRIEQSTDRPCTVRIVASRRILRSINGAN